MLSPNILERLRENLPEKGCVIDVGCGDGSLLREISKPQYSLCGVDFLRTEEFSNGIKFFRGSAENLPFSKSFADVVIMQCVFSLCDPVQSIREISRVLKENGSLLVADLFSDDDSGFFPDNSLIRNIYLRGTLEDFFTPTFSITKFFDETDALKKLRVRYGLWVLKKN